MQKWRFNLYVVWFSQILSMLGFGLCIPFLPFYIQHLGVNDPDQIKWLTGLLNAGPSLAMGLMAPVWGTLSDKYGRKPMILRAILAGSIMLPLMGITGNVGLLIVLRVLQGLFTGTVTAASTLIAASTPNDKLSYSLGFLSSSTFIGYTAGPALGGIIADSIGFQPTFFIGGSLMLVNLFLVFFFVKDVHDVSVDTPKRVDPPEESLSVSSSATVLSRIIVLLLIVLFFIRISRSVFSPFLPLFVQDARGTLEGSTRITGYISGLAGLFTALSGITLCKLGDRMPKIKLMQYLLFAGVIASIPLMFLRNLWFFALSYSLMMFVVGSIEPLTMSLTSEMTEAGKRGRLFGIQTMVGSLGWSISPFLGSFVSIHYSYGVLLSLIPLFTLIAFIFLFLLKRNRGKANQQNNLDFYKF